MKVRIHRSFLLYLFIIGILSSPSNCFSAILSLLVHELGHYIASRVMGEEIESIELTPFGGVMHRRHNHTALKGLRGVVIALAGPLANYVFIYLLGVLPFYCTSEIDVRQKLILSNLTMMGLNLLPVIPLDGGQAVFSVGYYFLRIDHMIAFLAGMGQLTGGLLIAAAIYGGWKTEKLNCSIVMIGFFLFKHARNQRNNLRMENLCLVLREQLDTQGNEIKRVFLYSAPPDMPLYAALAAIHNHTDSVFFVQNEDRIGVVGGKKLCYEMLHDPHLLFEQIAVPIAESE